jgi:hypothetical protein
LFMPNFFSNHNILKMLLFHSSSDRVRQEVLLLRTSL